MTNFIRSLQIFGFKAFRKTTSFNFAALTVFAGANSVGKSSVIQALLLSRSTIEADRNLNFGVKIPLNGPYLLALGDTQQVTRGKVDFNYTFQSGGLVLEYVAQPDDNNIMLNRVIRAEATDPLSASNFHYLNAERIGPRAVYVNNVQRQPFIGYQGEFAVQILAEEGNLISTKDAMNYGRLQKNKQKASLADNLIIQTENWLEFIIPGTSMSANRIREINHSRVYYNNKSTPYNVGFGISYVLPVVVAGLIAEQGSMMIVENPEAHLHPSGQSRIGQFLAAVAASGVQVVVETHSEHIINGIRLASLKEVIPHDQVTINFLSRISSDEILVESIQVDHAGNLSDFPPGFFDQVDQDLMNISQIRRKQDDTR